MALSFGKRLIALAGDLLEITVLPILKLAKRQTRYLRIIPSYFYENILNQIPGYLIGQPHNTYRRKQLTAALHGQNIFNIRRKTSSTAEPNDLNNW